MFADNSDETEVYTVLDLTKLDLEDNHVLHNVLQNMAIKKSAVALSETFVTREFDHKRSWVPVRENTVIDGFRESFYEIGNSKIAILLEKPMGIVRQF